MICIEETEPCLRPLLLSKRPDRNGSSQTIDNDVYGTDLTFGFNTAVTTATEAIDKIHTTASSHHRVMIVEVMGRYAGWIALHAGTAGGADIILIPEIPYESGLCDRGGTGPLPQRQTLQHYLRCRRRKSQKRQKGRLKKRSGQPRSDSAGRHLLCAGRTVVKTNRLSCRGVNLGHLQRGGTPTPFDRNMGTLFGIMPSNY